MVQGDSAALHVGPDPHFLGGTDEHGDPPGPACLEQLGFGLVVAGVVNEPHPVGRHPAGGELVAEFVVDVPRRPGGAELAEHQLQRTSPRFGLAPLPQIHPVLVGFPDVADAVGGGGDLPAGRVRCESHEAEVEGGGPSVVGDLQHVVLGGLHPPGPHRLRPRRQRGHVLIQPFGGGDDDRFGPSTGQGGGGQGELSGGAHVSYRPEQWAEGSVPTRAGLPALPS